MQEAVLGAEPLSLAWWVERPLWVLLLAVALAPLVAAFRRVERVPPASGRVAVSPFAAPLTLVALVVTSAGIALIVTGGMPGRGAVAGSVGFAAPELLAVTLAGARLGALARPSAQSPGA